MAAMRRAYLISVIGAGLLLQALSPLNAHAETGREFAVERAAHTLDTIRRLANLLIPLVVSFGLLSFFWGMAKFISHAGEPGAQAEGKRVMLIGIITMTVMATIWWFVSAVQTGLGLDAPMPSFNSTTTSPAVSP